MPCASSLDGGWPLRGALVMLLATLLSGVALSGCIVPPGAAAAGHAGRDQGILNEVRFAGCALQMGVLAADAEAVRPFLPENFTAAPLVGVSPPREELPGAAPGANATLRIVAVACESARVLGAEFQRPAIVQAWLDVDPPARFERAGTGAYAVAAWTLVSDPSLAAVLASWGVPASAGRIELEFPVATPLAQVGVLRAQAEHALLRMETPVAHAWAEPGSERTRVFGAVDGALTGALDVVETDRTRVLAGVANLTVQSRAPILPFETGQGMGVHSAPGYSMVWTRVALPLPALDG